MAEQSNAVMLDIKGTRQGLVILLPAKISFDELKLDLETRMAASSGFFEGASFAFQYERGRLSSAQILELEGICKNFGLQPRGHLSEQRGVVTPFHRAKPSLATRAWKEKATANCHLLFQTLRSGQQVMAANNLTILGDVNPGAELLAGGSIVVMGALRGTAQAGIGGDKTATVLACRLMPARLVIAGITLETDTLPPSPKPRLVSLHNGRMLIKDWPNR